jgi:alpha-glucoside transport system substrate-binding protein
MRSKHVAVAVGAAAIAVSAVAATTAGAQRDQTAAPGVNTAVSGKLSMLGVWTGAEQKSFQAVLDAFKKKYPNVSVTYRSGGDNLPTVLSTAVAGHRPPDLAAVSQPGLMKDFVGKNALKPITFARSTIAKNYAPVWLTLGTVKGKLYGLIFKGANKSTVWYNVKLFKNAGAQTPKTWPQFLQVAKLLRGSGTKAFSIGGGDGWTLTDLFENIYLRQAGPAKYDQLTTHTIKWTDPSVISALKTMAQVLGDTQNIAGGTSGALQTDFPTSVDQVFQSSPKAAMVIEADFVQGEIASNTPAKPLTGYNVFPFPSINNSPATVVGGGDTVMMFKDSPAARALVSFLATPQAASIWAHRGGFTSPNKNVKPATYPDALTRIIAGALASAKVTRFDMSDLQPSTFGGTVGQGEFKLFQDFLKSPSNAKGIAKQLETAAAKAYKAGK